MAVTCGNSTGVCVMEMVTRVAQMKSGSGSGFSREVKTIGGGN